MHCWLKLPGVSVALEAGIRCMCESEPDFSELRSKALRMIMVKSHMLPHIFSDVYKAMDPVKMSVCSMISSAASISMYMSLYKSLGLEMAEGMHAWSGKLSTKFAPFSSELLQELVDITCRSRAMWKGKNIFTMKRHNGSQGGTSASHDRWISSQAWLRLELILLRSWVLLCSKMPCKVTTRSAARSDKTTLITDFRELCNVDSNSPIMEAVLQACGLDQIGKDGKGGDTPSAHAKWERFAFSYVVGRLLPGCSNWGCTNITGFSETALPTLLCGGCRRARYCSAECQRAAWLDGGHSRLCSEKGLKD